MTRISGTGETVSKILGGKRSWICILGVTQDYRERMGAINNDKKFPNFMHVGSLAQCTKDK